MARTRITDDSVEITFGRWEKLGGLIHDQEIRFETIDTVEAVGDARQFRLGLRAPGYGGLRRRIGTYRRRGMKQLVCVETGRPAWRAVVHGKPYDAVVIGDDEAIAVAAAIRSRLGEATSG